MQRSIHTARSSQGAAQSWRFLHNRPSSPGARCSPPSAPLPAPQVAVQEVRRLQKYGVTNGELERYRSALLRDSEQLAEQVRAGLWAQGPALIRWQGGIRGEGAGGRQADG